MKAAIDASGAARTEGTGVAAYIAGLAEGLAKIAPRDEFVLYYRFSRVKKPSLFLKPPGPNFRTAFPPLHLLSARDMDVAHGPDARIFSLGRAARIVTVHDLFSLVSDKWANESFRKKKGSRYAEVAGKADFIICDSLYTADDFARFFPEAKERLKIVPLGVGSDFSPVPSEKQAPVLERIGVEKPYILSVGNIAARKNLVPLVKAFELLADKHPETSLILAGRPSYGHEEVVSKIEKSKFKKRIIMTGYLSSRDLPALYGGAEIFALPSLYEGFGLPVLEACACGTPVVASKSSSIPEVLGDAGTLINTGSPAEMADAMDALLGDETLRAKLSAAGIERAGNFTWERTARETLEVYREAAG